MTWNGWIKRQTNQYQISIFAIKCKHCGRSICRVPWWSERNGPSPLGWGSRHALGVLVTHGGHKRVGLCQLEGLVQSQQNKEQACMDQSFTRLPSLQLWQLNPPSTWLHGLPAQIHECASWNSPQLLPARLASYAPSPPGKALCPLPPAWTPPCPQPASHWALLFPSFLVPRFVC